LSEKQANRVTTSFSDNPAGDQARSFTIKVDISRGQVESKKNIVENCPKSFANGCFMG